VTKALKLVQFSKPRTWLPPRSLRLRLIALWLAVAAACGVAALLMWEMFQISVSAQVDRADAILGKGCASPLCCGLARGSGP
jgi:C4-dicarboxylate transporter